MSPMNPINPQLSRRSLLAATGAFSAALLAACGAQTTSGGVSGKEAGPDGTVRLQKMAWGSALEKEAIEKGLALFMQQQPKIQVEYLHQPDNYDDKLQALLAAGTAPDVFKVSGNLYADSITAGALMDVTDRMKKDPLLGKADYFIQPFEQERSTYKGKWYGIGSTAQEQVLYYNVEALKQAGVAVVANGGKIVDKQTLRYTLDTPEAIDAIQKVADLTLKDRVSATAAEMQGGSDLQRLASGKFAMWVSGNWNLLDLAPLGFKYGAGVLPRLKRPATTMTSSTTSVGKDTKKPEAAWTLFRFLNSDDYQLPLVQKGLWNPSHTSLLSPSGIKRWLDPNVHPEGYEKLVTDFMVRYGYADIPTVGIRKASTVLNEGLAQVWAGKAAAADVLKDTVARANKVLDEEQARVGR